MVKQIEQQPVALVRAAHPPNVPFAPMPNEEEGEDAEV